MNDLSLFYYKQLLHACKLFAPFHTRNFQIVISSTIKPSIILYPKYSTWKLRPFRWNWSFLVHLTLPLRNKVFWSYFLSKCILYAHCIYDILLWFQLSLSCFFKSLICCWCRNVLAVCHNIKNVSYDNSRPVIYWKALPSAEGPASLLACLRPGSLLWAA